MVKPLSSKTYSFKVPEMTYLEYHWKNDALKYASKKLKTNVLCQPKVPNLDCADAFCMVPSDEDKKLYMLVIFLTTVTEKHPIKTKNLQDIIKSFPEAIQSKIKTKLFVFITPLDGKLKCAQPYLTTDNVVIKNEELSALLSGFIQCVYRRSI